MTYTLILSSRRKPGISPEFFRSYLENEHLELIKRLAGALFPVTHTRRYISPLNATTSASAADSDATSNTSAALNAASTDPNATNTLYDLISELVFRDEAHFEQFMTAMSDPQKVKEREEDEAKFMEIGSFRIGRVEKVVVTRSEDVV